MPALTSRVSATTLPARKTCREFPTALSSRHEPHHVLDLVLELDRMVVEFSMHVYNLPPRDRLLVRKQNRRLHDAVREHLPRLLDR